MTTFDKAYRKNLQDNLANENEYESLYESFT